MVPGDEGDAAAANAWRRVEVVPLVQRSNLASRQIYADKAIEDLGLGSRCASRVGFADRDQQVASCGMTKIGIALGLARMRHGLRRILDPVEFLV